MSYLWVYFNNTIIYLLLPSYSSWRTRQFLLVNATSSFATLEKLLVKFTSNYSLPVLLLVLKSSTFFAFLAENLGKVIKNDFLLENLTILWYFWCQSLQWIQGLLPHLDVCYQELVPLQQQPAENAQPWKCKQYLISYGRYSQSVYRQGSVKQE